MCPKDTYHDVSRLDILTQKCLRYQHHRDNYLESLQHHRDNYLESLQHHRDNYLESLQHHRDNYLESSQHHRDNYLESSQHHRDNYLESLQQRIVPSGLKPKKKPAILPVSVDFEENWKLILKEARKKLVEKSLVESVAN